MKLTPNQFNRYVLSEASKCFKILQLKEEKRLLEMQIREYENENAGEDEKFVREKRRPNITDIRKRLTDGEYVIYDPNMDGYGYRDMIGQGKTEEEAWKNAAETVRKNQIWAKELTQLIANRNKKWAEEDELNLLSKDKHIQDTYGKK